MSQQHYLKHTITLSERWDTLAYYYYGNALSVNLLIDANPHVAFCEELPEGQIIWIPVIHKQSVDNSDMPPWMESNDD